MKLRKLAKDAASPDGDCAAVYTVVDDPSKMVFQGKVLDEDTTANLEDHADDETAGLIPTETVVRAVGRHLAEYGWPA